MADLIQKRNAYKKHTVRVFGNHTSRDLIFVVKDSQFSSVRKIEKRNLTAGGSDKELKASYDEKSGWTTIDIYIQKQDTLTLNPVKHYCDIVSQSSEDPEDKVYVYEARFDLQQVTQRDDDSLTSPNPKTYNPVYYSKYMRFVQQEEIGAELRVCLGYGNIDISENDRILSISSTSEFSDEAMILPNNFNCNWSRINESLIEIYLPENYGKVVVEIWEK